MFLSADVISLVLYCAQQLGVTLGVGAQSIMLVAYLQAMRDGVVDSKEAQFARAVRYVLNTGLALIILSGLGITALHLVASQAATIFSEAYLFKWALVLGVLTFTLLKNFPQKIMQGLAGGSWFALFIVHILAPVASWVNLLTLYVVWMVGFAICWVILVVATKDRSEGQKEKLYSAPVQKSMPPPAPTLAPAPAPAVVPKPPPSTLKPVPPPPPPQPKPVPSAPPIQPKPPAPAPANLPVLEQKHIVQTLPQPEFKKEQPAVKKEENPWLPSIQIMPKTQDDASKHPVNVQQHTTQN